MLDVYVVALLVGLVRFSGIAEVLPGPGIAAFGAVVVLTLLSSLSLDPRLIWDTRRCRPCLTRRSQGGPGEALPDLPAPAAQRSNRFAPSLVWVVPLVAAIAALSLTLRTYLTIGPQHHDQLPDRRRPRSRQDRGPLQGSRHRPRHRHRAQRRPRRTCSCTFAWTSARRISPSADTRFWVVRPRLGLAGVSGLGTLISGAYVAADAGNVAGSAGPNSSAWKLRLRCCAASKAAASCRARR